MPYGEKRTNWRGDVGAYKYIRKKIDGSLSEHKGMDIRVAEGTDVMAMEGGEVIYVGWNDPTDHNNSHGYNVVIESRTESGGYRYTLYGHMQEGSAPVKSGDFVTAGDLIGEVGYTGNAEQNDVHLHLEVRERSDKTPEGYNDRSFAENSRGPHVDSDILSGCFLY